jgi:2-C-methyl-D-erythritol 2,4-cyclodiphosphate synthase
MLLYFNGYDKLIAMNQTGIGFDIHRLVEGRRLIIGGVEIQHTHGLLGHSDADVLTHAIMDALLGAIADGDIGQHFSDRDPRWRDADSLQLLKVVAKRLNDAGWRPIHVDATVMAEAPKLAPHIPEMRYRLAATLGLTTKNVSVKATTYENLGPIGRKEGISAMAVATIAPIQPEKQQS